MSVDGVEIIVNGSGSYMELRKAYVTVDLVKSATFKVTIIFTSPEHDEVNSFDTQLDKICDGDYFVNTVQKTKINPPYQFSKFSDIMCTFKVCPKFLFTDC